MKADEPQAAGALSRSVQAGGRLLAWLFFVAFAITVYEVVMRYVLASPTSWVHETTTTLCAIAFAYGGAYAMVRDEHMRVSSLTDRLPRGLRSASHWLGLVCGIVYLAGLGWGTLLQAHESVWRFEDADGTTWAPEPMPGPPGWPLPALVKAALAAGTVLFLVVALAQAAQRLRAAR